MVQHGITISRNVVRALQILFLCAHSSPPVSWPGGTPFYHRLRSRGAFCCAPMLNASDREFNFPRFSTVRRLSSTPSYSTLQHQGLWCSSPSQARSNTTASASSPPPRFHSPHYKSDRGDCWLTLILSTIFPYVPFRTAMFDIAATVHILCTSLTTCLLARGHSLLPQARRANTSSATP